MSRRVPATHSGECQWCGRSQLLPAGVLAKHGYDLAHGFMRGVCVGAGHLPYQQSCGLIGQSIGWARAEATRLQRSAAEQRAVPLGVLECSRKVYHPELSSRTRGSVYLWAQGVLEGEGLDTVFVWGNGRKDRLHAGGIKAAAKAREYRHQYADALEAQAQRELDYAVQQERRIADWQPRDLTERAAA
jgi:hypothetical protein